MFKGVGVTPVMKLLLDKLLLSNTAVLEDFNPSNRDEALVIRFCQDAVSEPEVLGGIYYESVDCNRHFLELKNQSLFTLLYTLKSIALKLPFQITYDDVIVPAVMLSGLFQQPVWVIKMLQFFGLLPRKITYSDFFKYAQPSPPISSKVSKQSE